MAVNNFLEFDTSKTDLQTDSEYSSSTTRTNGVSTGLASSTFHNKMFRQFSVMVAAIGQVIADLGTSVNDSTVAAVVTAFKNTVLSAVNHTLSTTVQGYFGGLTTTEAALKNLVHKDTVVVLTTGTTWTPPRANMLIDIFMIGGGGGGGGGSYGSGGGGGGGGYAKFIRDYKISSVTPIACVIGAGGTGYSSESNTNGTDGGNTSFGSIIAQGGKGGLFSGSGGAGTGGDGGAGGGTGYSGRGNGAPGYGGDGTNTSGRTVGKGMQYDSTLGAFCLLNGTLYGGAGGGGTGGTGGAGGGGSYGASGTLYGAGGGGNGGNGYQGVIIIGYNS